MKDEYIRLIRRRVTDKLMETRDWYADQADLQRQSIEEIDNRLTAMRLQFPGVDPTNPGSVAFQVDVAEREVANLKREQSRLESRVEAKRRFLAALKGQDNSNPGNVMLLNPEAQRIRASIESSEARISELKSTRGMTDLHPDIVAERKLQDRLAEQLAHLPAAAAPAGSPIADTVAALEEFVTDPIAGMLSPEVANAELDLKSMLEQQAELREDIKIANERHARLVAMQGNVFETRNEFTHIQDELTRARADFTTFQGLVGQCDRGLTVEDQERGIRFADVLPPGGSTVPVSPQTKTVLILSILAGIACGMACVVLAELFDHRFRTSAQVSKSLGIPVLERIDEIVTSAVRRRRLLQRALVVPAVSVILLSVAGLSGTLAYLSLNSPNTYERLMKLPRSAWASLSGTAKPAPGESTAQARGEDSWDG
jgi:capsular polysaccharide biosynthesis protein